MQCNVWIVIPLFSALITPGSVNGNLMVCSSNSLRNYWMSFLELVNLSDKTKTWFNSIFADCVILNQIATVIFSEKLVPHVQMYGNNFERFTEFIIVRVFPILFWISLIRRLSWIKLEPDIHALSLLKAFLCIPLTTDNQKIGSVNLRGVFLFLKLWHFSSEGTQSWSLDATESEVWVGNFLVKAWKTTEHKLNNIWRSLKVCKNSGK